MISILRWILLPFSLVYQSIVWLRNRMYDKNILKSQSFDIATIVIGNLAIGGAGKSPMTEHLIRLLKDRYTIATLSRGYGRNTKGFKIVNINDKAIAVGDEPLQFKRKFPRITVAVGEDRCQAVQKLATDIDIILLDDAYQHRKLKAGFYILLFDFNSLFEPLLTLPTGNFRDVFSSTRRADLIVITKCPAIISAHQEKHIDSLIHKYTSVPLFYSSILYAEAIPFSQSATQHIDLTDFDIVLFCGIANPQPLVSYLSSKNNRIHIVSFPDHHNYSLADYQKVIAKYNNLTAVNKVIITTEKDTQRIIADAFKDYPLYYIPITLNIDHQQGNSFDYYIENYISSTIRVNKH